MLYFCIYNEEGVFFEGCGGQQEKGRRLAIANAGEKMVRASFFRRNDAQWCAARSGGLGHHGAGITGMLGVETMWATMMKHLIQHRQNRLVAEDHLPRRLQPSRCIGQQHFGELLANYPFPWIELETIGNMRLALVDK